MKATKAWWCAWIGLEALSLSGRVAGATAVMPTPPGSWFAADCAERPDLRPLVSTPMLLRVLTSPADPGEDAIVLRTPEGRLYAPLQVFESLSLTPSVPALHYMGHVYHPLDRVPGLRYAVDVCRQVLSVDRSRTVVETIRVVRADPAPIAVGPELGAYVQTQAQVVYAGAEPVPSALVEGGVFGRTGQAQAGALYDGEGWVHLDARWTHDNPAMLTRLTVGDAITRGGGFGRALRFGGVQWGRAFALRPDLVTFPLPVVTGAAALPSAVEVYVDNTLRVRDEVPAGPFQLTEVPVFSGAGEIQLVVTDLLGRSRVERYAFYASPDLLREGLHDYTVDAGFERLGFGQDSFRYGAGFGAATWRYGVSDRVTVEAHAESSARLRVFGAGYTILLPYVGVFSSGLAIGSGSSDGGQLQASLDRQGQRWGWGAQYLVSSRDYLRVGEQQPATLRQSLLRTSWRMDSGASLSIGWLDNRSPAGRVSTLNAGYTRQLGRAWSVSFGGALDLLGRKADAILVTLAYASTPSVSAYAVAQRSAGSDLAQIGVQRSPGNDLDWSGRIAVDVGDAEHVRAGGDYRSAHGTMRLDVEHAAQNAVRLGVDSGLVMVGRDLMVTRPLAGPFALVETDARQPVRVEVENRTAGRVRAGEPLLVPNIRPYQRTRIAILQSDFSIEDRLDSFERMIEAPGFGAVRVRFAADPRPTRRLRLRLPTGEPVPVGADVVGGDEPSFVGFGGESVVTAAAGRRTLTVDWLSARCVAFVELNADDDLADPPLIVDCAPTLPGRVR